MSVSLARLYQAIWLLCTGAREAAFRNIKTIAECLADELINAAKVTKMSELQGGENKTLKLHISVLFVYRYLVNVCCY